VSKALRAWERRRWRQDVVAAFVWGFVAACALFALTGW